MPEDKTIYGVWDGDTLIAVGTIGQVRRKMGAGRHTRPLSHEGGTRYPTKWRDIAAAALRDVEGLDYEEIAELLDITVGMAQGAVSRVRCGRYADDD